MMNGSRFRTGAALALLALIAFSPACRTKRKVVHVSQDEGPIASIVNVADPRTSDQLVAGFYNVEDNAWRWTMKNFTVSLRPPTGAAQTGAKLVLKFTIPDAVFNRVGPMTLDAYTSGVHLDPQTFSKAGTYEYVRDVPPSVLQHESASFDFSVDKALPPGDQDARELAIVVSNVGLILK